MRILLIEDDDDLADVVGVGLRQEHFAVDCAATVEQATELLLATHYDLVLLDLGLPDGDGLELCRRLQDSEHMIRPRRLLILTARDAVRDRVAGLDAGADDYLTKPFSMAELAARVRALSRRDEQRAGPLVIADLTVDPVSHRVSRSGTDLSLTGREFAVLRYLASRAGHVVSAEELLEHCWDANADAFSSSQRVIMARLRKKLGEPSIIETIRGVGYRLADQP